MELFGTLGTAGTDTTGTLVAGGAGTTLYGSNASFSVVSGTVDCMIAFGTAIVGTGILVRGQFAAGEGHDKSFVRPVGANETAITFRLGGAGTANFNIAFERN